MFYVIVNPIAGKGRALAALPEVVAFLRARDLPFCSLTTESPGHATRLACSLPDGARVLSLGGDGTLHEIAAACIGTTRAVGVLPGGSGDDFAFALGLERHRLAAALEVASGPNLRPVDTAVVNGLPFVNSLGAGFDAEVAYRVHHAPRPFKERSAYLYAVLRTLGQLQTPVVDVSVDGRPFYRGPALLASVQNGPRTGGSFLFAPDAVLDDGKLELLIATDVSRLGVMGLLPKVMKGRHLGHPKVLSAQGARVTMRWSQAKVAHTEGELLPPAQSYDIAIRPRSLLVATPPDLRPKSRRSL